jgi:hypothetical protein
MLPAQTEIEFEIAHPFLGFIIKPITYFYRHGKVRQNKPLFLKPEK